jgi:hypothetical protein
MSLARMGPATGRAGTARSWPAWTVLALSIGLWAASVDLGRAHGPLAGVPVFDVVDVVIYTAFLAWTVVGAVIVSRRPSNRIGWLLYAAGLLILLFPDGHLPSPRWRWVAWCYGLLALPGIVGLALLPGPQPGGFFELGPIPNPLGWEPAGEVLRPVNAIAQVVATALLGVAVVSMVLRLRRASGLGLVVVPAAIGVAVLRYRLYDIDRLINRTLVYGLLTLLLGGGYAAKTIEAFSARLRDEVDLDTLTGELLAVAAQTVEPTKASLWLRDSGGRS